jgi:hypothetical protein
MIRLMCSHTSRRHVTKVLETMRRVFTRFTGEFVFYGLCICETIFSCREVFNKIAAEEVEFYREEESDNEFEIPSFGTSSCDYEKVSKKTCFQH